VAFKSIAAYRSGLRINPLVSAQESEDALHENLRWGSPVRVSKKALVDFIFVRALEVATQRGIPMQIHTGYVAPFLEQYEIGLHLSIGQSSRH
jgi:hypothetical protein